MIFLENVDNNYIKIVGEDWLYREVYDEFSFLCSNYKYSKAYRRGFWDGRISTFNRKDKTLLHGNYKRLINFLKNKKYTFIDNVGYEKDDKDYTYLKEYTTYTPRDYQLNCLNKCLRDKRKVCILNTGAGKSLVIFLLSCFFIENNKNCLLIVPNTSLVEQMYNDFINYSNKLFVGKNFSRFYGKVKEREKRVVISTYSSLILKEKDYFEKFQGVIVDECHSANSADSYKKILLSCKNANYRFGFTATLSEEKISRLVVEGLIGEVERFTKIENLIRENKLTDYKVNIIKVKYDCDYKNKSYGEQLELLSNNEPRNRFIANLAKNITKDKGNTLILLNRIEHGKTLLEFLRDTERVFFVYQNVTAEEKEIIKRLLMDNFGYIVISTFNSFSTGINIPSLDNLIIASSTKSEIRLIQSIGRIIRKSDNKEFSVIWDIQDCLENCYFAKHAFERNQIYKKENIKTEVVGKYYLN